MKLYTDEITAQTSNREHNLRAKKLVSELKRKEGKIKLIGKNNTIFTFKTKDQMNEFKNNYPNYFDDES